MELPVLLIEEDPATANEIGEILSEGGFKPILKPSLEEANECLSITSVKAILLSNDGPNDAHLEFIAGLKGQQETKWLPLIILSRKNYDVFRIECFNKGADDFLLLPVNHKELLARVRGWINRIGSFEELAFRDPLTKAYNRRYFDHQIMLELQRSQKNGYPISVAFIDADKFKSINDNYGHHIGDLVLQGLSAALQDQVRSSDIVARYGGEEFVVLLPNANGEQASQRMHAILEYVRKTPITKHEGKEYFITFSCGVCEWKSGMIVAEWIKSADDGVYAAKEQGRNRVILSNINMLADEAEEIKPVNAVVIGKTAITPMLKSEIMGIPIEVVEFKGYEDVEFQQADLCIIALNKNLDRLKFEQFRDEKLSSGCKVLWVTESRSEDEILQSIVAGIDGYIRAPYSEADVEIGIKQVLN